MSEFIPIAAAAQLAAGGGPIASGRIAVLRAIVQEILEARSYCSKVTRVKFNDEKNDEIRTIVNRDGLRSSSLVWITGTGPVGEMQSLSPFTSLDAMMFINAVDGEWFIEERDDGYRRECITDWRLGRFEWHALSYHDRFYGGEDEQGFCLNACEAFGVEVESEAVNRLLVPHSVSAETAGVQINPVSTAYDWESAFADVAAALYFDIEFERVDARGAQQEIVRLLRKSFEKRGKAEPGETMLKAKARKIQASLRSHKSE